MTPPRALADLRDRARRDIDDGPLPSCQFAVARHGELLAFETLGDAGDGGAGDAPRYVFFSATKGVFASAVWALLGDGALGVDTRVADVVPEFAANGKDAVTVDHLLTMTAGFPRAPLGPPDWWTREGRVAALARWRLDWEPGTRCEYHATSASWVLAEVVERVAGEDYRAFLRRRVLEPMGVALRLGDDAGAAASAGSAASAESAPVAPASGASAGSAGSAPVAPVASAGSAPVAAASDASAGSAGSAPVAPKSGAPVAPVVAAGAPPSAEELEALTGIGGLELPEVAEAQLLRFADAEVRALGHPAAGIVGTAADMAMYYQRLLDDRDGVFDPAVLADVTAIVRTGTMVDPVRGAVAMRTRGLMLAGDDGDAPRRGFGRTQSPAAFGHDGAGGMVAWADPATGLSFAYVTNGLDANPIRVARRSVAVSDRAAAFAAD